MNILVTGGAGFIGRWVVKKLLEAGHKVVVFDNLSNGRRSNVEEFLNLDTFSFVKGDIRDTEHLGDLFNEKYDVVYHLAASINVQDSIDNPWMTFENDVLGTFNILEKCRLQKSKVVFMSTCMVYAKSTGAEGITEDHPVKPASPYAASKISGEALTLSYHYAYNLPVVIVRPFNTYGPFQKTSGEGGVVSIFIKRYLQGQKLNIYGEGTQTRDLLYVEDCADFVIRAGMDSRAVGHVLNAGLGRDISINKLAELICKDRNMIEHVPHIHPQSEIQKLLCNYAKAKQLLEWQPLVFLEEGIKKTREWIEKNDMR